MTRTLSIALALMAVATFASTVRGQNETREAIDEAVRKAVDAVEENYAKFLEANEAPLATARESLNSLVGKLNADRKFTEATKVQNALVDLEKTVMQRAVPVTLVSTPKPKPVPAPPAPPPERPLLERLAGKWTHPGHPSVFLCDSGNFAEASKEGKIASSGRVVLISDDAGEAKLDSGAKVQLLLISDNIMATRWWSPKGERWPDYILERTR